MLSEIAFWPGGAAAAPMHCSVSCPKRSRECGTP
jgi:hypothetical protein